jgi:hypothetical protein
MFVEALRLNIVQWPDVREDIGAAEGVCDTIGRALLPKSPAHSQGRHAISVRP